MIMKWRERKKCFSQIIKGPKVSKPKCVRQYNVAVGAVDLWFNHTYWKENGKEMVCEIFQEIGKCSS